MKEDKLAVCRLCLSLIEAGCFDLLDEIKKEMLAIVLPELNSIVTSDPVICKSCDENLEKSYGFKTEYLNYYRHVKMQTGINYQIKCTICCLAKRNSCTIEENILLKDMLEKCLPEVNITEKTAVCETCMEVLQNLYNFVVKCLDVEEKLQEYSTTNGCIGQINLFSVFHNESINRNRNVDLAHTSELVPIKSSPEFCEVNSVGNIKMECVNIKMEYAIEEEDIHIKSDKEEDIEDPSVKKKYKCDLCEYQTSRKSDLTLRHALRHKKPEELTMYKCTECPYESKRRGDLNSHLAKHADSLSVYKCGKCYYRTIYKSKLEGHVQKHMLPEKYKCEECSFSVSYKKKFLQHLKSHKRKTEKTIYQCELCSYETRRRTDLTGKHMLKHRRPEELVMHKCQICDFQAKHKTSLTRHTILKHLTPTPLYQCSECNFVAKSKSHLTSHVVGHQTSKEVNTFVTSANTNSK